MTKICVCCKQPIDEALVIESTSGPVHPGPCYNFVLEQCITESDKEELNEVQLML